MGNLKSLVLLALLFSFSVAVFANTSNDATHGMYNSIFVVLFYTFA